MLKPEQKEPMGQRPKSRIPLFKSIEEAAEFWDTHDSTEFEGEFEDVPDVQFLVSRSEPKKGLTVRLAETQLKALRQEAAEKGIGPSTLVRMLILEHLRGQKEHRSRPVEGR